MSENTNDIVANLRQRHANVTGNDPRITKPIVGATIFQEAADEIERLRAERDEARRVLCRYEAHSLSQSPPQTANQVADRRGWDCFKENTND
jgi:hypothetical protein